MIDLACTGADHTRPQMRLLRKVRAAVLAILLAVPLGPVAAQEGTLAQRRACEPDVFRLCRRYIPDHGKITACLERNKQNLNADCRAVFEGRLK